MDSSHVGANASSNTCQRGAVAALGSRTLVFPALAPLEMASAILCIRKYYRVVSFESDSLKDTSP
jgi:hypothetical protein